VPPLPARWAAVVAVTVLAAPVCELDRPTAAFGMIAGGAAGIIAIADELEADNRLVAVLQYLRVLVIVVLTPLVAGTIFPGDHGFHGSAASRAAGSLGDAALLLALSVVGGSCSAGTTFVLAVQVLRLFVMLLAAPVLARWLVRERTSTAAG
jgi:uncharacterized membrane protein AbrB (regulator of aidB expression)